MRTLTDTNYTGRKARPGRICFDSRGKMQIFVTYCDGCNGKVVMTTEEARLFSGQYITERKKTIDKLLLTLVRKRKL